MNKLIKNLLILALPVIVVVAFFEYNLHHMQNSYTFKKDILEKNQDAKIIILGTSHTLGGINPQFLDEKALNLANSDQPIYDDYKILEQNLDRLKNLDTVIIPVSDFSLEFKMADTVEYWREFLYERYFNIPPETSQHLFDIKRFSLLALYGQRESLIFASKFFKENLAEGINDDGFQPRPANPTVLNEAGGEAAVHGHDLMENTGNIPTNTSYLISMIQRLKQRNIKAVLITAPVLPDYYHYIDPQRYQRMQKTLQEISASQNIPYLNYLKDPRFDISDFSDTNHLSAKGAEKFTRILNADVKK